MPDLQLPDRKEQEKNLISVTKPEVRQRSRKIEVSFLIRVGTETQEVWFRTDHLPYLDYTNVALATVLLPAMKLGSSVELEGALSPRLLEGVSKIQEIFYVWDKSFQPIEIKSKTFAVDENKSDRKVACFFSGGVDSFYTLLKNLDAIDSLVLIHGFDFKPDFPARDEVVRNIKTIASEFGKDLVEVETNLRDFADRFVGWGLYHGAALASVALLLAGHFKEVFIPSSHSYRWLVPWGSHPLVDPLWGTEELRITHDGCEATRVKKVGTIAKNDVAMSYLRVCWENKDGAYNCGKCEKCLRTMINLLVVNASGKCKTFTRSLDLGLVSWIEANDDSTRDFILENLNEVRKHKTNPELEEALVECIEGLNYKGVWGWPRRTFNFVKRGGIRRAINI